MMMMDHRRSMIATALVCVIVTGWVAGCSTTKRNVQNAVSMSPEASTLIIPTYTRKTIEVKSAFAKAEAFGGEVSLHDGSRWEVRDADQREAMTWRPESRVIVVRSTDDEWPYTVINLDTLNAEGLRVRRVIRSAITRNW